jgi:tRNA(Ile2) C34 agmatinyltransferase TiaS
MICPYCGCKHIRIADNGQYDFQCAYCREYFNKDEVDK